MIYVGSDHAGFKNKEYVKHILKELKISFEDVHDKLDPKDDYPKIGKKVAELAVKGKTKGIILCNTGIGISIAANKVKGARAALVHDAYGAEMSRKDNDANILAIPGRLPKSRIKTIIMTWMKTKPSQATRHKRRRRQLR